MRHFEQDWMELGCRVARSLHYQLRRNLRLLQAAPAEVEVMAEELAEPALDGDQGKA